MRSEPGVVVDPTRDAEGRRRRAAVAGTVLTLGAVLLPAPAVGAAPAAVPAVPAALAAPAVGAPLAVGGPPAAADPAEAGERQADLVANEDRRLTEALVAGIDPRHPNRTRPAYRVRASGLFTMVLTRRKEPYTFDDLRRLAPDTLLPQGRGTFLLRENIVVAEGATLAISPSQPLRIRLSSGPEGFVSLVTVGGRLRLNGTAAAGVTVQSWDESHGRPDTDLTDGRAYVRASGQLVARYATFSRLGFWSGRTGGLSVVGSGTTPVTDIDAGAVSAAGSDTGAGSDAGSGRDAAADGDSGAGGDSGSRRTDVLPTGRLPGSAQDQQLSYGTRIEESTIEGNAFGLFVTGNSGPRVSDTVIRQSVVDGLVLHRDVESAQVSDLRVERSGRDGVVLTRKVEGSTLTRLEVSRNGRDGVVLAGRPLASGPSASGQSTRPFGNNVLTASQSTGNARIGIHVIGGTTVRVAGNAVTGGRSGIVVSDGAAEVDVDSNRIERTRANGIQVRESGRVTVTGNIVRDSPTGIHVRNASGLLRQNATSGVTLHGITFVGRVTGSVADRNLLAGSGTSAIDLVRVAEGTRSPELTENDVSGWARTVTGDSLMSLLLHPLTVIWIFVGLALLAMSRPRRGGPGLPYRADPLGPGDDTVSHGPSLEVNSHRPEIPVVAMSEPRLPAPVPAYVRLPDASPDPWPVPAPTGPAGWPAPPADRPTAPAGWPAPPAGWLTASAPTGTPAVPSASAVPAVPSTVPTTVPGQAAAPDLVEVPALLPVPQTGRAVIDIAIREARLNPVPPRRRRVNGR